MSEEKDKMQKELNQSVFDVGQIIANIHLLHKQKQDLLNRIEQLTAVLTKKD